MINRTVDKINRPVKIKSLVLKTKPFRKKRGG